MHNKEIETYSPQNQTDWRQWLEKNHQSKERFVWHRTAQYAGNSLWALHEVDWNEV